MGTGILTTALLLIVGYLVITRLVGLAFRLVVPVVLLLVLAGAGLFSGLTTDRGPADWNRTHGYDRRIPDDDRRLGDLRLRDLAEGAADAARSLLRSALGLLDRAADARPQEERLRPYSRHDPAPRDRLDEDPFGGESPWDGARSRREY